jgi:hypothetical protein
LHLALPAVVLQIFANNDDDDDDDDDDDKTMTTTPSAASAGLTGLVDGMEEMR